MKALVLIRLATRVPTISRVGRCVPARYEIVFQVFYLAARVTADRKIDDDADQQPKGVDTHLKEPRFPAPKGTEGGFARLH